MAITTIYPAANAPPVKPIYPVPAGPPGAPGTPGLNPRGDYDSGATYAKNDAVRYNGAQWIARTTVPPGQAPADNAYWSLFLQDGEQGIPGPPGPGTGDMESSVYDPQNKAADAFARANHTGTQSADTITDGTTNKAFLATERTKLAGIAVGATANSPDAFLLARANHTGTQSADTIVDGTTNKAYTATEKTKLAGIAAGATANSTDAFLLARANHTGTQSADTLTDGTTNKAFLATERTKLVGIATGATANSPDATLLARANHTGTQTADTITDGTTNKAYLATERTKLAGIATGATANSADAFLLARANHTGTQAAGTITGLATVATSGSYNDLSNKPGVPFVASFATGIVANGVTDAVASLVALEATAEEVVRLKNATYYIGTNYTPSKVLRFSSGTRFLIADGVTVDFSTQQPEIHGPKKQRFDFAGSGTGVVSGLEVSHAGWFAGDALNTTTNVRTALQKWANSLVVRGTAKMPRGFFTTDGTATITFPTGQQLKGIGRFVSILRFSGTQTRGFEISGVSYDQRGGSAKDIGFDRQVSSIAPTVGAALSFTNGQFNVADFIYTNNVYTGIYSSSYATIATNLSLQDTRQSGILVDNVNECQSSNTLIAANSSWATLTGVSGTFVYDEVINLAGGGSGHIYPDGNGNYKVIFDGSTASPTSSVAITGATSGATATITTVIDGHNDGGIYLKGRCNGAVFVNQEVSGGYAPLNVSGASASFSDKSISVKFTNCFFDSAKGAAAIVNYAVDVNFTNCWFSSFAPCVQDVFLDNSDGVVLNGCQWTYTNKTALTATATSQRVMLNNFVIADTNSSNAASTPALKFDAGSSGIVTNGYIGINRGAGPSHPQVGILIGSGCAVSVDTVDVSACPTPITDNSGGSAKIFRCNGYKTEAYGAASVTTDASGNATVNHGLASTPAIAAVWGLGSTTWDIQMTAFNATTITFRARNTTNNSNIASTAGVLVHWQARMLCAI